MRVSVVRKCESYDILQSLLIDLQYTIADIVGELARIDALASDYGQAIHYEAFVTDAAARHLVFSIQSALSESFDGGGE